MQNVDLGIGVSSLIGERAGIRRDEWEESLKKTAFPVDKMLDSLAIPLCFSP
jgi:hypothetical protein